MKSKQSDKDLMPLLMSHSKLTPHYYPFGLMMPGRSWSEGNSHRYGFSGKEKDDEVNGVANTYDFGARIYNSRLGMWLSVDPLFFNYPHLSPYEFVDNNPINSIDPDGMDIVEINMKYKYGNRKGSYKDGYSTFARTPSGEMFLKKFTNGHDTKIFGENAYIEPGAFAKHTLEIATNAEGNPYAGYSQIYLQKNDGTRVILSQVTPDDVEQGVKLVFQIVVAVSDNPDNANEIGHEAFVHLNYRADLIEKNVLNRLDDLSYKDIASELSKIGKMSNTYLQDGTVIAGGADHKKLKQGKSTDFNNFIDELSDILPSKVMDKIHEDNTERNQKY